MPQPHHTSGNRTQVRGTSSNLHYVQDGTMKSSVLFRTQPQQQTLAQNDQNPLCYTAMSTQAISKAPVLGSERRARHSRSPARARGRCMSPPPVARSPENQSSSHIGALSLSSTPPKQYMPKSVPKQTMASVQKGTLGNQKDLTQTQLQSDVNNLQAAATYKTMYDLLMAACQLLEQRFSNLDQARSMGLRILPTILLSLLAMQRVSQ